MHSSIRRFLTPVAAVALTVGVLSACAEDDPAEFDTTTQASGEDAEEKPEEAEETGADADEEENSDGDAESGDVPSPATQDEESGDAYVRGPEEALDAITYDLPDRDMEVTVGLHTLRVEGDVMLLELSFTPEGGRDSTYGFNNFSQGRGIDPLLHDRENLKQYSVLGSGGDRWSSDTSVTATAVESGQTIMYYAYYAAPEDDIDTMNITVIDGLVEFTDAEIEQ